MESLIEERDPLLLDPETNKKSVSKLKSSTSVTEVKQIGNCYCGKDRNLNILELLCATCNRWFHESCIGFQIGKLIKFSTNYVFYCKNCSPTGLESFRKLQATIPQMCMTAIANMQQIAFKEGVKTLFFDKDHEIIPFIEQYWESMTTMPRRVTQSWYSTVHRALTKEINTVFSFDEITESGQMYGLKMTDLTQIKPNYETIITKALRMSDDGVNETTVYNRFYVHIVSPKINNIFNTKSSIGFGLSQSGLV